MRWKGFFPAHPKESHESGSPIPAQDEASSDDESEPNDEGSDEGAPSVGERLRAIRFEAPRFDEIT